MIYNPQPEWLALLLFVFPGIVLLACAVNSAIFPPEERPLSTIPAILLVLGLLPTHFLALGFGSLSIGVSIAWTVTGLAGYAWGLRHWKGFSFTLGSERTRKLAIALLASYPIVPLTLLLNIYDDDVHQAIIANLQNGAYPPRYLYEPLLPLRYHYGFDLAASIITGIFRVRPDHAIDILTLVLWPCMFLLLWRVGNHFGGKRAGLFVALAICYAGGWPVLCTGYLHLPGSPNWFGAAAQLAGYCKVGGLVTNPPFISDYFQHPWSIGMVLFSLVVLQRAAIPRLGDPKLSLAMMACSLSLLSLCQAPLFVCTIVALGISDGWRLLRDRAFMSGWILLAGAISLLGAKLAGGFFTSWPDSVAAGFASSFVLREYFGLESVLMQAQWDLATFGALLVLGTIGIRWVKRDQIFLMALAVFPFFILHGFRYRFTWDIVKFATVTAVSLGIGAGISLRQLWDRANTWLSKSAVALVVAILGAQGIIFPILAVLLYSGTNFGMIKPYFSRSYPIDQDDANAISYLRTHMGPQDIVFRIDHKSKHYATWGGLPTQYTIFSTQSEDNDPYGLGPAKLLARKNLSQISASWFDRLAGEHIGWLVTDPKDTAINKLLEEPAFANRVSMIVQYGSVQVFRVH